MVYHLVTGAAGSIYSGFFEMLIKKEHATTGVDELDNTCDVSHNRPAHRTGTLANWVDNCKAKSARLG